MGGEPYTIQNDALYDERALCKALGLKPTSLERARKSGALRFTRRGGNVLFLGAWVKDWLLDDESTAGKRETAEGLAVTA